MSARLLKKVLKEQEKAQQQQLSGHDGSESDSPDSSAHSSNNPFDILGDHDQGNESEIADEISTLITVPSSNHKSNKKKRKKSKENSISSTDKTANVLDVILESLSLGVDPFSNQSNGPLPVRVKPANVNVGGNGVKQCGPSFLQVDPKFLSAENELRRIFGSKVVNSFEKVQQTGSSRQIRGGRRGSHLHRKTILVSPSENWPRWDGFLFMELLNTKDGYQYFRYVHSSSYSETQRAFEAAKAIHDLSGIASILLYHPYHLDSLITLAKYFQFSGEHQMSVDFTAKCLYALECAWHPMFTPLLGNCQLKYGHETNKPIFTTLFSHMKNMDRRGCHRSALEICKLLFSLDSDDPLGALFCIDYFSIRAKEYAWLEKFSEEYKSDNSLWLFPNFSYALAICRFYLENEVDSKDAEIDAGKATSIDLMKQALMLHPSVLKKIVAKVPLKDPLWTKILEHSLFGSDQSGSPSLDHLINIYVEKSYIIWRLPDLQKFLRDSALLVIETFEYNGSDARDWACVRKEAFSSKKNEYSHLLVSDFSDSVPTMPPDNLQNLIIDPRMREVHNGDLPGGAPRDVENRNVLAVLFESMLPWFDYGTTDGEEHERDED